MHRESERKRRMSSNLAERREGAALEKKRAERKNIWTIAR